jgi:hypothetical protein
MTPYFAKVAEGRERFEQDPTPENRGAYQSAFKAFTDWVLRMMQDRHQVLVLFYFQNVPQTFQNVP